MKVANADCFAARAITLKMATLGSMSPIKVNGQEQRTGTGISAFARNQLKSIVGKSNFSCHRNITCQKEEVLRVEA